MPTVDQDMRIDVVNAVDDPIGTIRRSEVFAKLANFRVVHILIFNDRGEVLIQQLAHTRERHPGYWGSSTAAYLFSGESYEHAARRRLSEELGLSEVELRYVGKTSMYDTGCHKFIGVYSAQNNGPFRFDPTVIERVEFIPKSQVDRGNISPMREFTPTFLAVMKFYDSQV